MNELECIYDYPQNFHELVEIMRSLDLNDFVENDDTGHLRHVRITNIPIERYELYEDHKCLGCTPDVVAAASFIAEGWEY
jgi:hypothetical protein